MLTTGLRWAPDTAPINRMTANTVKAGAVTAAARPICPCERAPTTPAPAATITSRNVPNSSLNNRRHFVIEISEITRPDRLPLQQGSNGEAVPAPDHLVEVIAGRHLRHPITLPSHRILATLIR